MKDIGDERLVPNDKFASMMSSMWKSQNVFACKFILVGLKKFTILWYFNLCSVLFFVQWTQRRAFTWRVPRGSWRFRGRESATPWTAAAPRTPPPTTSPTPASTASSPASPTTSTVVSCRGLIHSCWEPINQRTSAVCHFSYDFNCGNLL